MVTFEDFEKLEIKIGKVVNATKIEGTDKLLKLEIDLGTDPSTSSGRTTQQLVAGIAEVYKPDDLVGKELPVLVNLEPREIRGIKSQGMILAIEVDGKPVLLLPEKEVPVGSVVK